MVVKFKMVGDRWLLWGKGLLRVWCFMSLAVTWVLIFKVSMGDLVEFVNAQGVGWRHLEVAALVSFPIAVVWVVLKMIGECRCECYVKRGRKRSRGC